MREQKASLEERRDAPAYLGLLLVTGGKCSHAGIPLCCLKLVFCAVLGAAQGAADVRCSPACCENVFV